MARIAFEVSDGYTYSLNLQLEKWLNCSSEEHKFELLGSYSVGFG